MYGRLTASANNNILRVELVQNSCPGELAHLASSLCHVHPLAIGQMSRDFFTSAVKFHQIKLGLHIDDTCPRVAN